MSDRVRVWDLPTRLFHWALVVSIALLVISGYRGGSAMDWHARFGYCVLTLLLFRIVWGFVGGRWSRFKSFIYGPSSVINYLKGKPHPDHLIGHNPLGAGSVFAMLAFLLAQVATGLIGDDEISFTGPLNRLVTSAQGLAATWYHKRVGQWILAALIAVHVGAILFYLFRKKDNLITPMLHGDKLVTGGAVSARDDFASRLAALVVLAICGVLVAWLVQRISP